MRLFIAVNPPEDVRNAVYEAAAPLRDADAPVKWVAPEAIHCTLKFLGNVADDRMDAIAEALDATAGSRTAFPLAVEAFGAFPSPGRPRVFWAGLEAAPALELLQHELEQRLAQRSFEPEGRPFRPHLTLGRTKRGGERAAAPLGERLDDLGLAEAFTLERVALMESVLGRGGARYTLRHAAPLRPA